MKLRKCKWRWNQLYFQWITSCGHTWDYKNKGGSKKFTYCPFCGNVINEKIIRMGGVAI